ncbi:MAG: hypothetical protein D6705_07515 [Deltaproteobacteria bacterium]|nr:MAG: hypothetical protein D6705_07515 [Deltaproteobacteria bacterium]
MRLAGAIVFALGVFALVQGAAWIGGPDSSKAGASRRRIPMGAAWATAGVFGLLAGLVMALG